MNKISESHVEEATLAWLTELGYDVVNGLTIGPDGSAPERGSYGDVILVERLKAAIARLNPHLNADLGNTQKISSQYKASFPRSCVKE
jgi:type I restriction enzyme R subunit